MNGLRHRMAAVAAALSVAMMSAASEPETEILRPVTAAYTVEAGSSHIADTYLSPIRYAGWSAGFGYGRMQAMKFSPERWVMALDARLTAERTLNRVGNATMWYWGVETRWAMMRRVRPLAGLTVGLGVGPGLKAGCLYSQRNGNNPASAKVALTVDLSAYAAWNIRVGRLPVTLCYRPVVPLTGVFFAPDYGELYYEIYLGNHSGLARMAWWGNYFALDHSLTADLHFGNTSLRIGYSGQVLSTKASDITSRMIRHCAVIGVSGEWLSVSPRKKISPKARMIHALYE